MRHINLRSIVSILIVVCVAIYAGFDYYNLTNDVLVMFGLVSAWICINAFPFRKKYDGELHVIDEDDKKIYRFVVYDDPENLSEKDDFKVQVINSREKH